MDASVNIARRLQVPRIVVGGTIVSIATTTPELVVSATASWMKDPGIALGNAVGSVIANISLIVGLVLLTVPVALDKADFQRRSFWMLVSAVLVIAFSWQLRMNRLSGVVLVLVGLAYLILDAWVILRTRKTKTVEQDEQLKGPSLKKSALIFMELLQLQWVSLGKWVTHSRSNQSSWSFPHLRRILSLKYFQSWNP